MNHFIDKDWLKEQMDRNSVRVIDCRFQLGNQGHGLYEYEKNHLPGAIYFDLNQHLSSRVLEHGGRHPLPNIEDFKQLLEETGISNDTTVVAYDGGEGAFAARLWWLMKYVGHDKVYILNGGYKAWVEAGFPVNAEVPQYKRENYEVNIQENMLATYEEVKQAVSTGESVLIDSRDKLRYLGIEEPIDKKPGHIPGAIHHFWMDGFTDGMFKKPSEHAERFKELKKSEPIIVYCGSGVTATPNVIALKEAGFTNVKLYAGSYSDWVSYDENEVETD